MKRLGIKCTLISDLIISSRAANEGFHKSLDYIPGSKFLGIVAKELYDMSPQNTQRTLDIFHNGKVRFGDAHPLLKDQLTYKAPLTWVYPKKEKISDNVALFHKLDQEDSTAQDTIYVPVKDKYFSLDRKLLTVEQNFSIKSAYDRELYRSKDEQMYGYYTLKKGTQWLGFIDFEDNTHLELVTKHLIGLKRMGRSKSSQYGLIKIEEADQITLDQSNARKGEAYLYAFSNLCFLDPMGNATAHPSPDQLKLPPKSKILWEKSKIRTRKYQSWNKKRHRRNHDRFIIEKGSVFTVLLEAPLPYSSLEKGVGAYNNEGFGYVLLNPSFLTGDSGQVGNPLLNWSFEKAEQDVFTSNATIQAPDSHPLLQFIKRKKQRLDTDHLMDKVLNKFINQAKKEGSFSHITSSQWGQVRNIAKNSDSISTLKNLLFNEKYGFLFTGPSKSQWKEKHINKLKNTIQDLSTVHNLAEEQQIKYVLKLCSLMAKSVQQTKPQSV